MVTKLPWLEQVPVSFLVGSLLLSLQLLWCWCLGLFLLSLVCLLRTLFSWLGFLMVGVVLAVSCCFLSTLFHSCCCCFRSHLLLVMSVSPFSLWILLSLLVLVIGFRILPTRYKCMFVHWFSCLLLWSFFLFLDLFYSIIIAVVGGLWSAFHTWR